MRKCQAVKNHLANERSLKFLENKILTRAQHEVILKKDYATRARKILTESSPCMSYFALQFQHCPPMTIVSPSALSKQRGHPNTCTKMFHQQVHVQYHQCRQVHVDPFTRYKFFISYATDQKFTCRTIDYELFIKYSARIRAEHKPSK